MTIDTKIKILLKSKLELVLGLYQDKYYIKYPNKEEWMEIPTDDKNMAVLYFNEENRRIAAEGK